ncbi:hypothetical protein FACS1894147_04270 [Spirochaetia bacterium]|nr:hypothetical protein FACS1894147_04270 [Spirochaetia bacterium]
MKTVLTNYDIYPKVFPAGKESKITLRPLGAHCAFHGQGTYRVTVIPMTEPNRNHIGGAYASYELAPA